jgi:hypothetical protein
MMLLSALAAAHAASDQIEPKAGTWKTWVISSDRIPSSCTAERCCYCR